LNFFPFFHNEERREEMKEMMMDDLIVSLKTIKRKLSPQTEKNFVSIS